jgi:hypothetical protein
LQVIQKHPQGFLAVGDLPVIGEPLHHLDRSAARRALQNEAREEGGGPRRALQGRPDESAPVAGKLEVGKRLDQRHDAAKIFLLQLHGHSGISLFDGSTKRLRNLGQPRFRSEAHIQNLPLQD